MAKKTATRKIFSAVKSVVTPAVKKATPAGSSIKSVAAKIVSKAPATKILKTTTPLKKLIPAGASIKSKVAGKVVKKVAPKLAKRGLKAIPFVGTAIEAGGAVSDVRTSIQEARGETMQAGQSLRAVSSAPRMMRLGKRFKGKIPKAVRRWATRIVSRRKQEEKLIKKLFGSGGGKVVKTTKFGSRGVITRLEAQKALSR